MKIRTFILVTGLFIVLYVGIFFYQKMTTEKIASNTISLLFNTVRISQQRLQLRFKEVCEKINQQQVKSNGQDEIYSLLQSLKDQENFIKIIIIQEQCLRYILYKSDIYSSKYISYTDSCLGITLPSDSRKSISINVQHNKVVIIQEFTISNFRIFTYMDITEFFKQIISEDTIYVSHENKFDLYNSYINLSIDSVTDIVQYTHIKSFSIVFETIYNLSPNLRIHHIRTSTFFNSFTLTYWVLYSIVIISLVYFKKLQNAIYQSQSMEIHLREELLKYEHNIYKSSLDSLHLGIIILNNYNHIIYANPYIIKYLPSDDILKYTQYSKIEYNNLIFSVMSTPLYISDQIQGTIIIFTDITLETHQTKSLQNSKIEAENNEKIYRSFFELSPDAIIITQDFYIKYINAAGIKLCEFTNAEELIDLPFISLIHNEDVNKILERAKDIIENKQVNEPTIYRFLAKSGKIIYGETKGSYIIYNNKPAIVSVIRDVTKSYKEIQELYMLDRAIQALPLGVTITNLDHDILYTNAAEAMIHGYNSYKELLGKSARIFSPEDQWSGNLNGYFSSNSEHKVRESINIHKDNHTFPVRLTSEIIYDKENLPIGIITICEDITSKKILDLELLRLKKAIDTVQAGVTITNSDQLIIYANQAEADIHKYNSPKELIGKPSTVYAPQNFTKNILKNTEYPHTWKRESVNITKDGYEFPVEITSSDIFDNDKYIGRVSICLDITQRKEQELKLLTSEKRFKLLFEQSPIGLIELDLSEMKTYLLFLQHKYNIIYFTNFFDTYPQYYNECIHKISIIQINNACSALFSASEQEIKSLIFSTLFTNSSEFQKDIHEFMYNESYISHHNYHISSFKNQDIYIETYFAILAKNGGQWKSALVSMIDVTKKTLLQQEYLQLSYAVHNSANAIIITDIYGNIKYCNPSFTTMTGYERDEVIGKNPRILKSEKHSSEFYAQLWKTISSGNIWQGEIINKTKLNEYYTEFMTITPVIDKDGIIVNYIAIKVDITLQKQQEKQYKELYQLVRLMADTMPDLMWAKNLNKEYIFVNKAICEQLLCAKDTQEPIGKTDMYFAKRERSLHQDDLEWHTFGELCQDSDDTILLTKTPNHFEEFGNIKHKFLYLDVLKAPLYNEQKEMIGIVGSARIVTEQRMLALEKEELLYKLQESEKEIRNALYEAPFPVILYDTHGNIHIMSEIVQQYGQFTDINSKYTVYDFSHRCKISSDLFSEKIINEILLSNQRYHYGEIEITLVNQEKRLLDIYMTMYGDCHIMLMGFDITELRLQEIQLQQKKNLLQTIIDVIPDPICVKDMQFRYLLANNAYIHAYNISDVSSIIGKSDNELEYSLTDNFNNDSDAIFTQPIINKEDVIYVCKTQARRVLVSHIPLYNHEYKVVGILSYYKDVHDYKLLNDEYEKLNEQYKLLAYQTAEFLEQINKSHEQQHNISLSRISR